MKNWWKTPAALITAGVLMAGGTGAAVAATRADDSATNPPTDKASTPTGQPTAGAGHGREGHRGRGEGTAEGRGGRAHGQLRIRDQWVVKGKDGAYVTHNLVRGTVSAVDGATLRVTSLDGVAQTWTTSAETKVLTHAKGQKSGTEAARTELKVGDTVAVSGPGTTTLTARRIVIQK